MLAIRGRWSARLARFGRAGEAAAVFGRRNLLVAEMLFFGAIIAQIFLQELFHINPFGVSPYPHYIYQAQSFLHGRWDLAMPASATDIIVVHGKNYIVYPPFPALVLLPFVAVFGLATSDILITSLISAGCLSLMFLLFEQVRALGFTKRSVRENVLISVLFYFGTITLYLSLGGRMWHTAHIVALACALLALLLAFRRQYAWAAVALGCAFFSRSTAALAFPLILYLAWQDIGASQDFGHFARSLWERKPDWRLVPWRRLAPPLAVFGATIVLFLLRDWYLFGSPLESGYNLLLTQRYPAVTHGPFSILYVPADIMENFFTFPAVHYTGPYNQHPTVDMLDGKVGISVFFTTPLFLLLFWRNRKSSPLRAALWATIGLIVAVVLVFHAAGYVQFGARYLVEAYPYAFLLMALNEVRLDWRYVTLGLLGIAINCLGAYQIWTGKMPIL